MIKIISLFFITLTPILLWGESSSSVNCTGTACNLLPSAYKTQINELPSQFQSQYMDKVLANMNESSAAANSVSGLMGMGTVNTIQFGGGLSASGSQNEGIDVKYRDFSFKNLPNVGFGFSPTAMLGVNLGWILGQGPRDADEVGNRSLLHRINIYANGFSFKTTTADMKAGVPDSFNYTGKIAISQMGFGIRIDLVQPGEGIFLRFLGVNAGGAIRRQNFAFELDDTKSSSAKFSLGSLSGNWNSQTHFEYSSKAYSVPIDFRTGFQILRMISIFGGLGVSRSVGESSMEISRSGPVRFSVDPGLTATLSAASNTTSVVTAADKAAGNLELMLNSSVKKNFSQSYALLGVEIDIWKLKLLTEAYLMENVKSVSVGVKLDF